MSAVLPHLEITPQRPDWLAGHIGFELRCAERKFISSSIRQDSDSREPTQTVLSFRRIIFWYHIGVRILSRGPSWIRIELYASLQVQKSARFLRSLGVEATPGRLN